MAERVSGDDEQGTDAVVVDKGDQRAMPKSLDLKVDVDKLEVEEAKVEIENLSASLDLKVSIANFVNVQACASAHLGKTSIEVKGVDAEAHLGVDINNVARVVESTLEALAENPEILKLLEKTVEHGASALGIGLSDSLKSLTRGDENVAENAGALMQALKAMNPVSNGDAKKKEKNA